MYLRENAMKRVLMLSIMLSTGAMAQAMTITPVLTPGAFAGAGYDHFTEDFSGYLNGTLPSPSFDVRGNGFAWTCFTDAGNFYSPGFLSVSDPGASLTFAMNGTKQVRAIAGYVTSSDVNGGVLGSGYNIVVTVTDVSLQTASFDVLAADGATAAPWFGFASDTAIQSISFTPSAGEVGNFVMLASEFTVAAVPEPAFVGTVAAMAISGLSLRNRRRARVA